MEYEIEHTDDAAQDDATNAVEEISLPHELKLVYPKKDGDKTIDTLMFTRRPVAGDMRGIKLRDMDLGDHIITLTARLVSYPPSFIAKLDVVDLKKCMDVVNSFFSPGPTTGKRPAE